VQGVKTWLPRLLVGLAAAVLLWALGRSLLLYLDYMRILIAFPYSVDYGEGPVLSQVLHLARFESIYPKEWATLPYTIGNYPPLYHLVQLPFAWVFGPAYWYGRVINLVSMLVAAAFIGLTIHTLTRDWLAAVAGGAMLLAFPYILHWSGFVRVDSLALGVSWAGLFTIARWPSERKALIITALCLTGAIFTRQSYGLAAPFAAFAWLLIQKPRRRALELALLTGGFSGVLFVLLNLLTRGGFYFNIITANVNPFFWETVRNYWNGIWEHIPYLVVTSLAYLAAGAFLRHKAWWLAGPYLIAATVSAITVGKDGSNANYLFELSAALALLAGLFLSWLGKAWEGRKWVGKRWWLLAAGMLLLAWQVNGMVDWTRTEHYRAPAERALHERTQIAAMFQLVAQAGGPVLADEFMGLIPLAGKELVFQPFEFKQLVVGGIWDQQPLLETIQARQYALILLYDPPTWDSRGARWTPEQIKSIEDNYMQVERLADTRVYVPVDVQELIK
jgi:hypothetical protein